MACVLKVGAALHGRQAVRCGQSAGAAICDYDYACRVLRGGQRPWKSTRLQRLQGGKTLILAFFVGKGLNLRNQVRLPRQPAARRQHALPPLGQHFARQPG